MTIQTTTDTNDPAFAAAPVPGGLTRLTEDEIGAVGGGCEICVAVTVALVVYTIARNTCLSALRSQAYRVTTTLDGVKEPTVGAVGPEDVMLRQCLSRLPDIQRDVITLFYYEDRSIADVAQALDLPEGTVKSHLHRARRALGEMME